MYNVRCFQNTGFNSVNVPYNHNTVISSASGYYDVPNVDIVQERFLTELKVSGTWSQGRDTDYIMIWEDGQTINNSWCYFVTDVIMINNNTISFSVIPDFLTSFGGVGALSIVDGITRRSTHALGRVSARNLSSSDEYLAPSQPMVLYTEWIGEGDTGQVFIESTVDIVKTAQEDNAVVASNSDNNNKVTYPVPVYVDPSKYPVYKLNDNLSKDMSSSGTMIISPDGYSESEQPQEWWRSLIASGLSKIRGMGLESSVISQVYIPDKYCEVTGTEFEAESDPDTFEITYSYYITEITGKWTEQQSTINMRQLSTASPENDVLNFSEYCKYGIMSASGESLEADPKDLMTTGNPVIRMMGDPRPDGKPYFRFKKINNDNISNNEFFRNCISGLPWKNVPLVYTEKSGNLLNTTRYNVSKNVANVSYLTNRAQQKLDFTLSQDATRRSALASGATGAIGGTGSFLASLIGAKAAGGFGPASGAMAIGGLNSIAESSTDLFRSSYELEQNEARYKMSRTAQEKMFAADRLSDMVSYGLENEITLPEVNFPYNTETLRDFYGNGVLVYRFWYSSGDVARLQRIVRAYGVKYTEKTIKEHFIPTGDFCYCEATGVSITNVPRWATTAIAEQISGGIRVWNVRPYAIQ